MKSPKSYADVFNNLHALRAKFNGAEFGHALRAEFNGAEAAPSESFVVRGIAE